MENKDGFSKVIYFSKNTILRILIGIMTISLLLGTFDLIYLIYQRIIAPPFLLLEVSILFDVFNMVLIIAVGYELIKSLLLIISEDKIPALPIVQIAIIAVANKIITIDIKHTDAWTVAAVALLIAALGLAHFLLGKAKKAE